MPNANTEILFLDKQVASPAAIYLAALSPSSRRTMKQSLETIAILCLKGEFSPITSTSNINLYSHPWHQLRYPEVIAIRSRLREHYAPSTANKILSALRRVLKECFQLGLMPHDEYAKITGIKLVKGSRSLKGRALSAAEMDALFLVCASDTSNRGIRDGALLSILRSGLRRSEIVALNRDDIDLSNGSIAVLKGKGNKARVCYLTDKGIDLVANWLSLLEEHQEEALFLAIAKGERILSRRLTPGSVLTILVERGSQAGVKNFSCHDWRRTVVGDLLDAGSDIEVVARLMGHASVITTSRYSRRDEQSKLNAMRGIN